MMLAADLVPRMITIFTAQASAPAEFETLEFTQPKNHGEKVPVSIGNHEKTIG